MAPIFRGVILRQDGGLYVSELESSSKDDAVQWAERLIHPDKDYAVLGVFEQILAEDEVHPDLRRHLSGFWVPNESAQ